MSDAPPESPPTLSATNQPAAGAPLSISPQQLTDAMAAAREVLGGCRVERVLELSERISIAKLVLEAILRGELLIGRAAPSAGPEPKNAAPKPLTPHRPRPRRA